MTSPDDENPVTDEVEEDLDKSKDTLEDLDVTTDEGADVKGGRKAGGGQQDYT
jgi:hypothetical protein